MKKAALLVGGLFMGLSIALAVERKEFSGRSSAGLSPVYQNDGDIFSGFAVDCGSSSWTQIKASRAVRRRLHLEILRDNTGPICISTITSSGTACDDDTPCIELSTGSVVSIDLFTEAALNCRARADVSTQTVKGYETYDSGD